MRRDHVDPLADRQPRRIRIDDERRQSARARRLAGPGKHDVMVGDPAIGDPGLGAVDPNMIRSVRDGRGRHGRHVGARLLLRERESGDGFASGHRRQVARLQRLRSIERDRAGAEPLHGEGEIREPVVPSQDLAAEAERAHVERLVQAAESCRDAGAQEAGLAERTDAGPAGCVQAFRRGRVMRQAAEMGARPGLQARRMLAMRHGEERQAEGGSERHQFPSKTGFCFAAKAR